MRRNYDSVLALFLMMVLCQSFYSNSVLGEVVAIVSDSEIDGNKQLGPCIEFENTNYDLGSMRPLSSNKAIYKFTNIGSDTLHILNIKGCCGTKIGVDKKTYDPGKQGVVIVEFKTGSWPYSFKKQVTAVQDNQL